MIYVLVESELIAYETINCVGCVKTDLKEKFQEVNKKINEGLEYTSENRYPGSGNFFGKIRGGDFEFKMDGVNYVLEIDGLFVKSKVGEMEIVRDFDLEMEFDQSGKLVDKDIIYLD